VTEMGTKLSYQRSFLVPTVTLGPFSSTSTTTGPAWFPVSRIKADSACLLNYKRAELTKKGDVPVRTPYLVVLRLPEGLPVPNKLPPPTFSHGRRPHHDLWTPFSVLRFASRGILAQRRHPPSRLEFEQVSVSSQGELLVINQPILFAHPRPPPPRVLHETQDEVNTKRDAMRVRMSSPVLAGDLITEQFFLRAGIIFPGAVRCFELLKAVCTSNHHNTSQRQSRARRFS